MVTEADITISPGKMIDPTTEQARAARMAASVPQLARR
jgi:hypothetical protein